MPKFYTRYGKRIAVQLEFHFPSLTEQHHRDDCDINMILHRYAKTGELPFGSDKTPVYGDFSATPQDYRDAVFLINAARERFEALPSAVRERFGNDPERLLAFLENPANRKEAEMLGLVATVPAEDAPDARAGESSVCVPGAAEATPGATAEASGLDGASNSN